MTLTDGRTLSLPVDSASTSGEICQALAKKVQLSDTFGFSLYVSMYEKVTNLLKDFSPVLFLFWSPQKFLLNLLPRLLLAGLGSGQRQGTPDGCHLPVRAGSEEAGQTGAARPLEAILPKGGLHPMARLHGRLEQHRTHLQADRPGSEAGRVPLRQGVRVEEPRVGYRVLEGCWPSFTCRPLFYSFD